MEFGYVTKSFDLDFSRSDSNDAIFHLAVTQEFSPENIEADILFNKSFES